MRIIAHFHLDLWLARFGDGSPDSFGGLDSSTNVNLFLRRRGQVAFVLVTLKM